MGGLPHDAAGNPSSCHGSFIFAALHLTQEAIGSPQAAQGFSRFLFMGSPCAAKHQFGLRYCLGGNWRRFFPAVGAVVSLFGATAPTIRAIHGASSIVMVLMILSVSVSIFRMRW